MAEWRVRGAFVLVLAGFASLAAVSHLGAVRRDDAARAAARTLEIISRSTALLAAAADAESAGRGYGISGGESHLDALRRAARDMDTEAAQLRLTAGDSVSRGHLGALDALIVLGCAGAAAAVSLVLFALRDALRNAALELSRFQSEALRFERFRALAQLAGGIAHDINNTISPIALYAESLLEDERDLKPAARHKVDVIRRGVGNVAESVARMRDFSRLPEPQATLLPVNLNDVLANVVELTRARWRDLPQQQGIVIDMRTQLAPHLPLIMGVAGELRDALVNLVLNAVDAMPSGGPLTLRTALLRAGAEDAVILEVADAGIGMNDAVRRRCMEPFFTTKGDRGSGLGLAMVYGTMQRHRSAIEIDSVTGRGTVFRFRFPVPTVIEMEAAGAPPLAPPSLDILVVDDDTLVSAAVRETLQMDGHRVTTADGGQAGIDAFVAARGNGRPFRVVITDMGMPHVDGQRVARAVKQVDRRTVVILLTGWGQRYPDGKIPEDIDCVLGKPPTRGSFRAALARAG
jgi:signal transduction histidine kinase/CheY-like chemotaxis protein